MALPTRTLPLIATHSDGDSSKWPSADKGLARDDNYYLLKIAHKWAKSRPQSELGGPASIATWRLNQLPDGYAGYQKARPNLTHVDRYVYGHPRGIFRSVTEFYPHFKHLMDNGGPVGCECKLCTGTGRGKRASYSGTGVTSSSNGGRSVSPAQKSSHFTQTKSTQAKAKAPVPPLFDQQRNKPSNVPLLPQGRLPPPSPPRAPRKQVDEDGTPDVFRELLNQLQAADEDAVIDEKIVEKLSPDWRMGHQLLKELFDDWKSLPRFVPRVGELVLFARDLKPDEGLAWDTTVHTWRKVEQNTSEWLERPTWEAGVVTQMPLQPISEDDLAGTPESKGNVTNSGFRVEPLSLPGSTEYARARHHRYVPLHGIRPLVYWQDCLRDLDELVWHQTVRHVLTTVKTFCVVGRTRFKGIKDGLSGAEATIFCQGAYIGSDLILTGDTVRLTPSPDEQRPEDVTDVMVVTAIKLRFVNLDDAGNDDCHEGRPYTICLHISGRALTLDHKRSFDGVGKAPISQDSDLLPAGLHDYGQWYHMTDPANPKARLEVPFTRVFSRVPESAAMDAWYHATPPPASFAAVNANKQPKTPFRVADLKRGLAGLFQSRTYALQEDQRIDRVAGKTWFWADTRIEALDLQEANNHSIGSKDENRTRKQMDDWRKALRALDGSKEGLADYHAEIKKRDEAARQRQEDLAAGSYGMVGAAVTMPEATSGSGTEGEGLAEQTKTDEDLEMGDADDIDGHDEDDHDDAEAVGGAGAMDVDGAIELSDDEL